jgi:dTMP kinase
MRDALRFIVLDGVEGCGKSTQLQRLAEALRSAGEDPVVTHEPGGTPVGEAIRQLLLSPDYPLMTVLTELFLFCASRAQHVQQIIRPALDDGRRVLCDRFSAATFAYQGYAGGAGVELAERVDAQATGGLVPDLTVILDLPPEQGLLRKFGEGWPERLEGSDRIEQSDLEFHRLVREGFLRYAWRHEERTAVVDADRPPDEVFSDLADLLRL